MSTRAETQDISREHSAQGSGSGPSGRDDGEGETGEAPSPTRTCLLPPTHLTGVLSFMVPVSWELGAGARHGPILQM